MLVMVSFATPDGSSPMLLPADRATRLAAACGLVGTFVFGPALWADSVPIQGPELEAFLRKAEVTAMRAIPKGVTKPRRVTLLLDGVRRDAAWKVIDDSRAGITTLSRGEREIGFEDTYRTDCAAYELDKLLGLGMIPATVDRVISGERGSLTLWIDNAVTEEERRARKLEPPDPNAWSQQIFKMRLFDNLIYNTDRNLGNWLITEDWQLRLIDHSRSFRRNTSLRTPDELARFSRSLLDAISRLDEPTLRERLGQYVTVFQIQALLERRDRILELAKKVAAERGEVVYYP
jgi:hypothetical protein